MSSPNKKTSAAARRSGNPAVRAGKIKAKNAPATITWKEKLILALTFSLGFAGMFFALSKIRPAGQAMNLMLSNIMFSVSGGVFTILVLLLLINGLSSLSYPKFDSRSYQKLVIMTIAFALIVGGTLAGFSGSNQNTNNNENTSNIAP